MRNCWRSVSAREQDENRKEIMINHFTLFGHGDKINQRIRQWLNEQYVLSKKDEED